VITVKNLSKSFGELKVLRNINETIEKGEKVAIIGPSGSGKSTFLRCLNLLETPTDGEIWFEGTLVNNDPKQAKYDIKKDTKAVIITYKDAATGQIVSTEIRINVVSSPVDPVEPGPIGGDGSAKELTAGQKAGIAIGVILGVALIAGAVVAVILIKKKKDGATKQASASDNADNDSNKEAGENSVDKTECEASAEGAEIAEEKTEQALTEENAAENVTADTQSLTDNNDSKAETTEEDSIITENDATANEATDSESPQTASEESVNTVEAKVAEDENND